MTTTWELGRAALACLLLAAPLAHGQTAPARQDAPQTDAPKPAATNKAEYPGLKPQAEAMSVAFSGGDYEKVAALTYPRVVEMAGGHRALAKTIRHAMRQMEADGMKLLSYTVGEPEPATRLGEQLYAIVPAVMKAQKRGVVLTQETFLIGISRDDGRNWTFLGGMGSGNRELLPVVLPGVWDKLKLPAVKSPTFERAQ